MPFYFRRVTHTEGVARTVVAPVVAAVLLTGAIALVVSHLDQFTGASTTVNILLATLVPAVFLTGLALARWLRRSRPEVYAGFAAEPQAAPDEQYGPVRPPPTSDTTPAVRRPPAAPLPEETSPCPPPTSSSPAPTSAPSTRNGRTPPRSPYATA